MSYNFYTKDDIKRVFILMKTFVADMYSLYDAVELPSLDLELTLSNGVIFSIDNETIKFTRDCCDGCHGCGESETDDICRNEYVYATDKRILNEEYDEGRIISFYLYFIENYDNIRADLVKRLRKEREKYEVNRKYALERLSAAEDISRRYSHESRVELTLPHSANRQTLVVKEENGKTIGTLDFGNGIVKIVTSGEIVMVDENDNKIVSSKDREKPEEKRKSRWHFWK